MSISAHIKEVNSYTRHMTVEVPWDMLAESYASFARKYAGRIKIPGFRKGKIPAKLVKQQYGPMIEADFAEQAVQDHYQTALDQTESDPINLGKITALDFHEGESLRFEATFEVEPVVTLPVYKKGMKFEKVIYEHDVEDVTRALADLQARHAQLKTVVDGAAEDHFLLVDMQELDASGMPLIGRKTENQYIHLSPDGPFAGENMEQLRGARAGETRRIVLQSPDSDPLHYELTIRQVTERIMPDLNDDFAKEIDPETETLDVLKARLGEQIQAGFDRQANEALTRQMADHFVRAAKLEVPESMVETYVDNIIADMERQGQPRESIDKAAVAEEHQAGINWNIKWYFLRKALIEAEEIEVDDDAVTARIEELTQRDASQANQVRNHYRRPENRKQLREEMLSDNLYAKLEEYAKIKESRKSSKDLRKAN